MATTSRVVRPAHWILGPFKASMSVQRNDLTIASEKTRKKNTYSLPTSACFRTPPPVWSWRPPRLWACPLATLLQHRPPPRRAHRLCWATTASLECLAGLRAPLRTGGDCTRTFVDHAALKRHTQLARNNVAFFVGTRFERQPDVRLVGSQNFQNTVDRHRALTQKVISSSENRSSTGEKDKNEFFLHKKKKK